MIFPSVGSRLFHLMSEVRPRTPSARTRRCQYVVAGSALPKGPYAAPRPSDTVAKTREKPPTTAAPDFQGTQEPWLQTLARIRTLRRRLRTRSGRKPRDCR